MRTRKGAALPGAILVGLLLLGVSMAVGYLLVHASTISALEDVKSTREDIFVKTHQEFAQDVDHDFANITDTTFKWESYEGSTSDIGALAAYDKAGDSLKFYCIYDFSIPKVLAYQTSSFYIEAREDGQYLAGLVKIVRGE